MKNNLEGFRVDNEAWRTGRNGARKSAFKRVALLAFAEKLLFAAKNLRNLALHFVHATEKLLKMKKNTKLTFELCIDIRRRRFRCIGSTRSSVPDKCIPFSPISRIFESRMLFSCRTC